VVVVIVGLIFYLTGIAFKPGIQYLSYVPFLIGILMNAVAYSKANEGMVTFGNIFGSCFKASMIVTLVMVAWSVLSMYLFPDMKDKAIEIARESMAKNPRMNDENIETALNITRKYWNVFLISGAIFGTLFYGAIFSVIGGLIAKKNVIRTTADNF
jgi:hypothetical protein